MGLKDMMEEEVVYWDDVIKWMVESDSWKGILREWGWESFYKGSGESSGWYGGMIKIEKVDEEGSYWMRFLGFFIGNLIYS